MEKSPKPIIVKGLPAGTAIMALVIGILFGFFCYFLFLYYAQQHYFSLQYHNLVATGISASNFIAIKILLGFLACVSVQTVLFPFVMYRIHSDVYNLKKRPYYIALGVILIGMTGQHFLIESLCRGDDTFKTLYIIAFAIALIQYLVIWVDFVLKYRKESYLWVFVTLLLSFISSGAYSVIL